MPGPVPKRTSQRRRQNKSETALTTAAAGERERPKVPPARQDWHPLARDWYRSLARSGQSAFYEASDWETARYVAESMSRELKPKVVGVNEDGAVFAQAPITGAALSAQAKLMATLLTTEGDRRRLRMELERSKVVDADEDAAVTKMADYVARFSS